MYPKSFQKLIEHFASLPSVGPKMAERLVLYLFRRPKNELDSFSENLLALTRLRTCQKCSNISENDWCDICRDSKRNQHLVCIVEDPLDVIAIEKTGVFNGLYHVLGGVILGADNDQAATSIQTLVKRIKNEPIEEIILATNPTTEGDATALYLRKKIEGTKIKITRLARGLATGSDIEHADEMTLSASIKNRREMN